MSDGYAGQAQLTDGTELNAQALFIKRLLAQVHTATIARVVAVHAGTVDVLPLVNQLDGDGKATPHETVYGLPYFRLQGGASAVIIDPVVGDLGIVVFASRDLTAVKATRGQANPGSRRRFSMADGMYLGGLLNGVPVRFVRISAAGLELVSPDQPVTITSPDVRVIGSLLTHNGVNVGSTHTHGGTTGAPR